tara:strand:- start:1262 stop:2563 length:1302 start_codon:yes stop_codon:yes gene_type:complete
VNKILKFFLIFIIISSCSFNKNSKFWSNEKIKEEVQQKSKKIFKKKKPLNLEFNPNLKIKISSKAVNKNFLNNLDNNYGRIDFDGLFTNKSKFKFSRISNFFRFDPEIIVNDNKVIFFNNKGAILKFDENSRLIWKNNFYTKKEQKLKPILQLASNNRILIVADNISKYYAVDIDTGELLWFKYNNSPFNSQIKIYKDKFFVIDSENILICYSLKDGSEIWKTKTSKAFIKSQKKLSIIVLEDMVYFNNSVGEISAVDIKSGTLIWQTPTQNSLIYEDSFSLKTSDLVLYKNSILLSNNRNNFFSLSVNSGIINWEQQINTHLRSSIINDLIFSVTMNGFLTVVDFKNGNLIRTTDIFRPFKDKRRKKIKPVGFIIGLKNIYLSTSNGKLLIIDIETGKTTSVLKISKNKISKPFIENKNMFLATDSSIIKLN